MRIITQGGDRAAERYRERFRSHPFPLCSLNGIGGNLRIVSFRAHNLALASCFAYGGERRAN